MSSPLARLRWLAAVALTALALPAAAVALPPADAQPCVGGPSVCGQYQVVVQNLGIAPMHVILTYKDTLIYIDRSDVGPSGINTSSGVSAYSVELNIHTLEKRGLETVTNTFCSAGHSLPNGRIVNNGGSLYVGPNRTNSYISVRKFDPCLDGSCDWDVNQTMGSKRWYPSSIRLPNGNIAFIGGSTTGIGGDGINIYNNPTFEVRSCQSSSYCLLLCIHLVPPGHPFPPLLHALSVFLEYCNKERQRHVRLQSATLILPTGDLLLIEGTNSGMAGYYLSYDPNYQAYLYDSTKPLAYPTNETISPRFSVLGNSSIARLYHSSVTVGSDALVWLAGSNFRGVYTPFNYTGQFPTEFRIETYSPPYFFQGIPQPVIVTAPTSLDYGAIFQVAVDLVSSKVTLGGRQSMGLYDAGFNSHANTMGQHLVRCLYTLVSQVTAPYDSAQHRLPILCNFSCCRTAQF
eukprot:SM000341S12982  [mRNA]  locus=s341:56504:59405:+ [translate_table: standard]